MIPRFAILIQGSILVPTCYCVATRPISIQYAPHITYRYQTGMIRHALYHPVWYSTANLKWYMIALSIILFLHVYMSICVYMYVWDMCKYKHATCYAKHKQTQAPSTHNSYCKVALNPNMILVTFHDMYNLDRDEAPWSPFHAQDKPHWPYVWTVWNQEDAKHKQQYAQSNSKSTFEYYSLTFFKQISTKCNWTFNLVQHGQVMSAT